VSVATPPLVSRFKAGRDQCNDQDSNLNCLIFIQNSDSNSIKFIHSKIQFIELTNSPLHSQTQEFVRVMGDHRWQHASAREQVKEACKRVLVHEVHGWQLVVVSQDRPLSLFD